MERKIRVGAVSYLNTKPLIYGFQQGMMADTVELVEDYPSKIASMLLNDEIDIGLVPVAIIPSLKEYHIVSRYGICANGQVASVCLFSDVPVQGIKTVLLDYQSRTSVALLKILLKEYWKIDAVLKEGEGVFEEQIKDTTAGLVIGDRAFKQRRNSAYIYDLAEAWQQHTGLGFVFAAWISNKQLDLQFITAFDDTIGYGLSHLETIVSQNDSPYFDLMEYYTRYIDYQLDDDKKRGLQLFLDKLAEKEK